jgi:acetyl esterase/lipase
MSLADERWRIILHMNWKAQMVPILVNGLPTKKTLAGRDAKSFANMPMPSPEQIAAISPYAQIQRGNYRTPTFIMHGTDDDLVPCSMSRETIAALEAKGVECGIACPEGAKHLFDTFPSEDPTGTGIAAVKEGYEFLWRQFAL